MSSWFKSILQPEPEPDDVTATASSSSSTSTGSGGGVVKKDLSSIGESIFRGVADFLAPPPNEKEEDKVEEEEEGALAGIRSDLAELGGSLKSSVSHFSKLASNFLQFNDDVDNNENKDDDVDDNEEEEYEEGVREEVVEYVRKISKRPELWIDFPLSLHHHDFEMSEAQIEHASLIEQLVPSLGDLRSHISADKSEKQFWMIYFILLLPKLNEDDVELLSTPQIAEVRETLRLMFEDKKATEINSEIPQSDNSRELNRELIGAELERNQFVGQVNSDSANVLRSTESNEADNSEKLVRTETTNTVTCIDHKPLDAKADSPGSSEAMPDGAARVANVEHVIVKEEPASSGSSTAAPKQLQAEDDVSFSDLEDDDNAYPDKRSGLGPSKITRNSSTEGSTGWVRLNENTGTEDSAVRRRSTSRDRDSEGYESTDWLTIDDFDP